jgi:microtubule-associated serine/threonine kinase
VHRDLKPDNMLIGHDGHIKLTDFGLSDVGLKKVIENVTTTKEKNRIVGTADYMAPETLKAENVSVLMDFWSLGVLAFEFLTGKLPFNSDTPEEIFSKILKMPIVLPTVGVEDG